MIKIDFNKIIVFILLCAIMVSCYNDNDNNNNNDISDNEPALARITFINNSSFYIDIFKNFNPQYFDPTTFIGTVDRISRKFEISLPASSDQLLGDTFYLRYRILLANSFETGTTDLFIHAERTMANKSFVIKSGDDLEVNIEEPPVNELQFINGIVRVQNLTTGQLWIENYDEILPQLGSVDVWLLPGKIGFYELTLPFLSESWSMEFLKSRDNQSNRTSFPSFEMERGKLYSFEINSTDISGPVITNLNLLAF